MADLLVRSGGREWLLTPGESLEFGRSGSEGTADIALSSDPRLSSVAGRITAGVGSWTVENHNRWAPIEVTWDDGVSTVRRDGRHTVTGSCGSISLQVDGQTRLTLEISTAAPSGPDDEGPARRATGTVEPLRRGTLYHYAVLALAEPRLRVGRILRVPSNKDIASVFRELGIDPEANEDRIEAHLRHARDRLSLIADPGYHESRAGARDGSRIALIEIAIATGAVVEADLELLDDLRP